MKEKVYICPEDCNFFRGEDGCRCLEDCNLFHKGIDEKAIYEKEGEYPLCPFYMRDLLPPTEKILPVQKIKCHCEQLYRPCSCSCDNCNSAKIRNRDKEAQRDADVAWHNKWYGGLLAEFKRIKVERAELLDQAKYAKEAVLEEIERTYMSGGVHPRLDGVVIKTPRVITINEDEWQSLKSRLGGKQ